MKRAWRTGSIRQRGRRWAIAWRENGRRRVLSFGNERDATEALARFVENGERVRAGLLPKIDSAATVGELLVPWLQQRAATLRDPKSEWSKWNNHLRGQFGTLRPVEITWQSIANFIRSELACGFSASTIQGCIRTLISFWGHAKRLGLAVGNSPYVDVPFEVKQLLRESYDTSATPFLERPEDIRRVFLALPEPTATMFAVGALAGLRTGEVLGLLWEEVDLSDAKICVRWQRGSSGTLISPKGGVRQVLIVPALLPILEAWRQKNREDKPDDLVFRPPFNARGGRPEIGSAPVFVRPQTMHRHLQKALEACSMPALTWYQCTRHTFATQWARSGGDLQVLRKMLGHVSHETTIRYVHSGGDLGSAEMPGLGAAP